MRRVVVFLAAAVAVVAAAAPARAGGPGGGGFDEWRRIPCFSGAIDTAELSADGQSLTLGWHLDCAQSPDEINARSGHGLYPRKDEAVAPGQGMQVYAVTAPTVFSATAKLPSEDLGICVVTDYEVRVACVQVGRDARGRLAVWPLPTDDPLVDRKVRFVPKETEGGGTCGGCW